MSFHLNRSRLEWLPAISKKAGGWTKLLMAPAAIGLVVAFIARAGRQRRHTIDHDVPSLRGKQGEDISQKSPPATADAILPVPTVAQIAEKEVTLPSREEVLHSEIQTLASTPVSQAEKPFLAQTSFHSSDNPSPDLESWRLPLVGPSDHAVDADITGELEASPRRAGSRRILTVVAIVVASAAIVYAAVGSMRSHPVMVGLPDEPLRQKVQPITSSSLPPVDSDTPPPNALTSEPPPPAEGANQDISPAPNPSAAPKRTFRRRTHKTQSRGRHTALGKTRSFLRKNF